MNIITTTALANFKKNKSRNILIGIAIGLTALLLSAIPTFIFNYLEVEDRTVAEMYPTFHVMYRNVDYDTVRQMEKDDRFETIGLREDPAYVYSKDEDVSIFMLSVDETARNLNKQEISEGYFPEAEDEIVVSEGLLKVLGLSGTVGDRIEVPFQPATEDGLGQTKTKEFTISGFVKDSEESAEKGVYTAYISEKFAAETVPEESRLFRVYARMADSDKKITDKIEAEFKAVGEEYGIRENDIVGNSTYLMYTYVDPAFYSGVAIILVVVMLAGILTVYSIYYVSMLDKVQEYGRLRAIGATKRQIRKLVFREGLSVYAIAAPVGIVLGVGTGILIVTAAIQYSPSSEGMMMEQMAGIWKGMGIAAVRWEAILLAFAVSFVTVYLSLLRPMQIAGKISAIEAIRFQNTDRTKKKTRKGYQEINTRKLTAINLGRNKKRTAATIISLGVTGILFIVVATALSCMNPRVMAQNDIQGEVQVTVDSWENDEMHPERSLKNIQKNNPLTEEFIGQISALEGVESVDTVRYARAKCLDIQEGDEAATVGICGLSEKRLKEAAKYVTDGSLDAPSIREGNGIIIDDVVEMIYGLEDGTISVGDKLRMRIEIGDETLEKEMEVAAVLSDAPSSLVSDFNMSSEALQKLGEINLNDTLDIFVGDGQEDAVAEAVRSLVQEQEVLEMTTYKEVYERAETSIGYMMYACYGVLFVFGLIGILNLVNTMINSVHVRKRELGMLQAIGMSSGQTVNMLQLEGLFYTVGTLVLSLGIGSALGYAVFLWAKEERIMSIRLYEYPVIPALLLTAVVIIVQILVTYLVNHNFKKQSLIERIRFSE